VEKVTETQTDGSSKEVLKGIKGVTYDLYKIMDLQPGTNPAYDNSYNVVTTYKDVLKTTSIDALKNYSSTELESLYLDLKKAAAAAKVTPISSNATDDNGKVTVSGLALGYYLVVESTVPAGYVGGQTFMVAIPSTDNYNDAAKNGTQWTYDVTVQPKNEKISLTKDITTATDDNKLTSTLQDGTLGVGDYVQYTVKSSIPNYTEEYFYETKEQTTAAAKGTVSELTTIKRSVVYKFTDIMAPGLTLPLKDSSAYKDYPVGVKVGDTVYKEGNTTYSVTTVNSDADNVADLTVEFVPEFIKEHVGEAVELTYYAQLNEKAVMGVEGNPNEVTLTYTNTPKYITDESEESTESRETTLKDDEIVYSFGIEALKFTKEGSTTPLAGAKFEIFTDAACTNPLITDTNGKEKVLRQDSGNNRIYTTDDSGLLYFDRLDAGTYYIKETQSPAGYTLLTNPIKVEIIAGVDKTGKVNGTFTLKVNDQDVSKAYTNEQIKANANKDVYETYMKSEAGVTTLAIENHKGFTLPATGGTGIALFLIIGVAGIVSVSVVLLKKTKDEI
jgi:fimbrial isopeptide formation D2 family protein/LPXTG-motif cell wall-anchored protein